MRFLDLNPLGICETGKQAQPGLSTVQNGKWIHGNAALAHCRQDPQSTRFTVWEQLSLEPISLPGKMRHLADLAVAQLQNFCGDLSREPWGVFTPVHWDKTQLQVFLGVATACKMDVRVLLPRVLAVNHDLDPQLSEMTAWEWQWNQLFKVQLVNNPDGWRVDQTVNIFEGGVLDFFRRQSRAAAKWALESQRVDPLHSGKTEQTLFDSWWKWQSGQGEWTARIGEVDLPFSTQPGLGPNVHRPWAKKHTLPEQGGGRTSPALAHALGWNAHSLESTDFEGLDLRLGEVSKPGSRWKERLPSKRSAAAPVQAVTHWVVDGIAEKLESPSTRFRPGERKQLQDGREALAVHVPEKD